MTPEDEADDYNTMSTKPWDQNDEDDHKNEERVTIRTAASRLRAGRLATVER